MFLQAKQTLRSLTQRPAYVIAAIAIIAPGVAASASMLGVLDALLWRALPYPEADRLVAITDSHPVEGQTNVAVDYPTTERLAGQLEALEAVGVVHGPQVLVWAGPDGPQRLTAALVSPGMLQVMGAEVQQGRLFRPDSEATAAGEAEVLLSHAFWRSHFGGADVIGRSLAIDAFVATVVGVLAADHVAFPDPNADVDVWLPVRMTAVTYGPDALVDHRFGMYRVLARTAAGAGPDLVAAQLAQLSGQLAADFPDAHEGWQLEQRALRDVFLGDYIRPVLALFVGAALLLVTGWANLSNLVMLRLNEQRHEIAVRRALGESGAGVARLVLLETFLLALLGGVPGVALALWIPGAFARSLPGGLPPFVDIGASVTTIMIAVLIVGATGLVLAGAAVVNLRRFTGVEAVVARAGRAQGLARNASRTMHGLIVAEVAAAVVLLVGAGLVVRAASSLAAIDLGVDTEDVWTVGVQLPPDGRPDGELDALSREMRAAVEALPMVQQAHVWSPHVPGVARWSTEVRALGQEPTASDDVPVARFHTVSPGAVTANGLDLVRGRDFTEDDATAGRRVMLVSETYARQTWPGEDALGKQLRRWNHEQFSTVVGVVQDAALSGRGQAQSDRFRDVYFLLGQDIQRDWFLLVRAPDDSRDVIAAVRSAIATVAPEAPLYDIERMRDVSAREQVIPRLAAALGAAYAIAAVLLAAIGLYAVLAYTVTLQGASIGLRMALGAQRRRVLFEVTGRGLRLALIGLAVGIVAAAALGRFLSAQLHGVSPTDPLTFVGVAAGVLVVASLACLIPARRATRIDPLVALRR